jgi:hypothetical protein
LEIAVTDPNAESIVTLEVVAKREGQEIGRITRSIVLNEADRVYLSELDPFETHFGPWPLGKGTTGSLDNNPPIIVDGQRYPKGLGLHSSTEGSWVKYRLGKTATVFSAIVAYNDDNDGKVTTPSYFEVYGDGKALWKSKAITSRKQRDECVVDVSGVEVLELHVTGGGWGAHAVWLDPRLTGPNPAAIRKAAEKK